MSLLLTQDNPSSYLEETPAEYAARLADRFAVEVPVESRRELAQFFTPIDVARFMAELARPARLVRRLLDPSAGTGVLACALCEVLAGLSGLIHRCVTSPHSRLRLHEVQTITVAAGSFARSF